MSLTNKLMKLAAKIALDKLIGETRTDELDDLLKEWAEEGNKEKALQEAKEQAADSSVIEVTVTEMIVKAQEDGKSLSATQRTELLFDVASTLVSLEDPPTGATVREKLLPGKSKTFVIFLDDPEYTGDGKGRFFHFYWDDTTYRIRDYISSRILYPRIRIENGVGWQEAIPLDQSVVEIWNASKVRIHSEKKYGLGFKVSEVERWKCVLELLTESARQLKLR